MICTCGHWADGHSFPVTVGAAGLRAEGECTWCSCPEFTNTPTNPQPTDLSTAPSAQTVEIIDAATGATGPQPTSHARPKDPDLINKLNRVQVIFSPQPVDKNQSTAFPQATLASEAPTPSPGLCCPDCRENYRACRCDLETIARRSVVDPVRLDSALFAIMLWRAQVNHPTGRAWHPRCLESDVAAGADAIAWLLRALGPLS